MLRFCETMHTLYQINPSLPAGIFLTATGGIALSTVGARTGNIALIIFATYSTLSAILVSMAAMHNAQPFQVVKETKEGFNTLPTTIVCHIVCLMVPLLAPPLFILNLLSQSTPITTTVPAAP